MSKIENFHNNSYMKPENFYSDNTDVNGYNYPTIGENIRSRQFSQTYYRWYVEKYIDDLIEVENGTILCLDNDSIVGIGKLVDLHYLENLSKLDNNVILWKDSDSDNIVALSYDSVYYNETIIITKEKLDLVMNWWERMNLDLATGVMYKDSSISDNTGKYYYQWESINVISQLKDIFNIAAQCVELTEKYLIGMDVDGNIVAYTWIDTEQLDDIEYGRIVYKNYSGDWIGITLSIVDGSTRQQALLKASYIFEDCESNSSYTASFTLDSGSTNGFNGNLIGWCVSGLSISTLQADISGYNVTYDSDSNKYTLNITITTTNNEESTAYVSTNTITIATEELSESDITVTVDITEFYHTDYHYIDITEDE